MGKIDVILKEFWQDNGRFAGLFNAVVFHGREILRPEDFDERDTDVSEECAAGRNIWNLWEKPGTLSKKRHWAQNLF